jgi:hypothetical protein
LLIRGVWCGEACRVCRVCTPGSKGLQRTVALGKDSRKKDKKKKNTGNIIRMNSYIRI